VWLAQIAHKLFNLPDVFGGGAVHSIEPVGKNKQRNERQKHDQQVSSL